MLTSNIILSQLNISVNGTSRSRKLSTCLFDFFLDDIFFQDVNKVQLLDS